VGFGSSDCHCTGHLFFFTRRPSFREFADSVSARA
jgi:Uri superfamily endonuclease